MDLLNYFFIFLLGSAVGSFLGVVIDRLPQDKSILKGRSHCDYCKKTLGILDLIPIFSFLSLRGKCRYCHRRLSYFYPIIEVITGVLFVLIFTIYNLQFTIDLLFYLFIVSSLVTLFFIDLRYGILPFSIIFPAILITILFSIFHFPFSIFHMLLAGFGAFTFFLALFLITRGRGMGFGDVVYAFFMGLLLGFPKIILGLYIAFISGAIISLILIAAKKKKLKEGTIAFGPFLVFGTVISLLWGQVIIEKIMLYFGI